MLSKTDFTKTIDQRFFKHVLLKSLLPFNKDIKRVEYLHKLYDKLLKNILEYKPKSPRKYISVPKNRYVIRMVPSFKLDDFCIYYFCLKVLEGYIAENRVPGTFGGFRLGGKLRSKENTEFEPSFDDSYSENSFNSLAWKQEYGEYQAALYKNALKMGKDYKFAIHYDIANFYDCIRLDLLENKIKTRVKTSKHNDEIHLLFRFLKHWNTKFDKEKTVGIPQDEVGDCSRILSNFFLQDYDKHAFDVCRKEGASYLRYADDHVVFAQSQESADRILYQVSHRLFKEGLNINTGKTIEFSSFQDFDDCYAFSIFEELKFNKQDVNRAFELFVLKKESCRNFRESSVLKRLLHDKINLNTLHNQKRIKLLSYLWDERFLLFANDHYMNQIYKMLKDKSEKQEYLHTLNSIKNNTKFESYKINFKRFENGL